MAMTIMNDASASMTLGELNKNISELGKQLKKVSSGMRINGAGDGPSEFSISEKMRVRIRALDQDERNVQNGTALLRVAEGAIQSQIEIMKTIKQKVIDADNDTNTDLDRMTIQKEIDQGYQQIEDIAQETNYNGKRLLVGDKVVDKVFSWKILDEAVPIGGDLNLIPDTRQRLDDLDGPFGVFSEPWATASAKLLKDSSIPKLGLTTVSKKFSGGEQEAVPHIISLDLSGYTDVSQLNNKGFHVNYNYFVLTDNKANNYKEVKDANEIDITGKTIAEVASAIASKVGNTVSYAVTAAADGSKVTFTGKTAGNEIYYGGKSGPAEAETETVYTNGTGKFSKVKFAGGKDEIKLDPNDPDVQPKEAVAASCTVPLGTVSAGQYITVVGSSTKTVKFVDGAGGISSSGSEITVGKDWVGTGTVAGVTFERKSNGDLVLTAPKSKGASANDYYVQDGKATSQPTGVQFTKYTALSGFTEEQKFGITPTKRAKVTLNLSAYKENHSTDDLETFIASLNGKVISHSLTSSYYGSDAASYMYDYFTYYEAEFVDSASNLSAQYRNRYVKGDNIDLNELRAMVEGGKSIAEAFSTVMTNALGAKATVNSDGNLEIVAKGNGTAGNNEYLFVHEGQWRSISIDLNSLFSGGKKIPEDLDLQGFRAYCATDGSQWFNFEFVNGKEHIADKPASGTDTLDIKTILIDVSGVTDAGSLAKAIYDQATSILTGPDPNYNHHMRIAADTKNGIVTLYDQRQKYVQNKDIYDYQEAGAKAADGVLDNVVRATRNIYVKDIVIHHTDHASQNIHTWVPQTTMDHLFGFIPGDRDVSEFNVMTAENRELLLGNKVGTARNGRVVTEEEKGYLDTALDYLTSANTLIGAQIMRLEMTGANIITSRESTMNSESTIRDADMAKEMTSYTKANVLAQAAQSMLAQANQNSSTILSLLQ